MPFPAYPLCAIQVGVDFKPLAAKTSTFNASGESKGVVFVFKENDSMEECRANLRKYQYDASSISKAMDKVSDSIQARLKELQSGGRW